MKIIQSFWSGNNRDIHRSCGWTSAKHHYLGWILSVNQLRNYYDEVTLFTDEFGYDLLINKLKLPYTHVEVVLDELNAYDNSLWALAKIRSYQSMKEPFLHVDGDVFIWKEFDPELLNSDTIVQNVEFTSEYYQKMWSHIQPGLHYLPPMMRDYDAERDKAYNMGIFGGTDIDFIGRYCDEVFDFVNQNTAAVEHIKDFNFNIFFEQVLFYRMAEKERKKTACLIEIQQEQDPYAGLDEIDRIPDHRTYLHFLGPYKTFVKNMCKIEAYVQKYYPEYYLYLEQMLEIPSGLSSFGFDYRKESVPILEKEYIRDLIHGNPASDKDKAIFCRNMAMAGNSGKLNAHGRSGQPFHLLRSSFFSVEEENDCLFLEMHHSYFLDIKLTLIIRVILDIVDNCISNTAFNKAAMDYIEEDFDQNHIQEYFGSLWNTVEQLASFGIIIILTQEEYEKEKNMKCAFHN